MLKQISACVCVFPCVCLYTMNTHETLDSLIITVPYEEGQ